MNIKKLKVNEFGNEFGLIYLEDEDGSPFIADWKTENRNEIGKEDYLLCEVSNQGYVVKIVMTNN